MWGCLARLVVSRRTQDTAKHVLAHAWGLQHLGVGAVTSSAGGRPKAAQQAAAAAAAAGSSHSSITSWMSISSSSSVAAGSRGRQPRSNTAQESDAAMQAGNHKEQLTTKQIRSLPSVVAMEAVFIQYGSSFNLTHTAAALNRLAKLADTGGRDSNLQQLLPCKWLQLLPEARGHQCATALCACLGLSKEHANTVWAPSWAAFMQHVQRGSGEGLMPQDIADAVRAAAKLRKQPGPGELQLLARKWLQLLPQAGAHQCASALCACVGLSKELIDAVWAPSWAAFMQHVQRGSGKELVARDIADAVCAAAKLCKQPGPGELQLLVQAFLQLRQELLAGASARMSGSLINDINRLSKLPGWQGAIRQQDMQQLRGVQQQRQAEGRIRQQIRSAATVVQLQHVCNERGGSFNLMETAAALGKLSKLAKLGCEGQAKGQKKTRPDSESRVDAVWDPTWASFMQHVQQGSGEGFLLQAIGQAVEAAAKLRKQPGPGELQPLVQAFLRPRERFSAAEAKSCDQLITALDQLSQLPGWQGGVSDQDMHQLLGVQQKLLDQKTERLLTEEIRSAETVAQLQHVCNKSGDSFEVIHAAAALSRFNKLSRSCGLQKDSYKDSGMLQLLVRKWLQLLPAAGVRECSNVLLASISLGEEHVDALWAPTWAALMQHLQRGSREGLVGRDIGDAMRAAAHVRKQPGPGDVQLLVQAFLQPEVLASAEPWQVGSTVRAVKTLSRLPGWQGGVSEQDWQLLLQQYLLTKQRLAADAEAGQPS